jgi:hypothetical protein
MAVARVPGTGYDTPLVGDDPSRFDEFGGDQQQAAYTSRRMSDTRLNHMGMTSSLYRHNHAITSTRGHSVSQMSTSSNPGGGTGQGGLSKKSQSEADSVNQYPEVDANSLDDGQFAANIYFISIIIIHTNRI